MYAHRERPLDLWATYLLARVLFASTDKKEKQLGLEMFGEAAARGYAIAFNNLALRSKPDRDKYLNNYIQLILKDHFSTTFKYLWPRARSKEHQEALRWLAEQAASIGVGEAHEALAEMASDQQKRKMHLVTGARFSTGVTKLRLTKLADRIVLPLKVDRDIRRMANDFELRPIEKFGSEEKEKLSKYFSDNPS